MSTVIIPASEWSEFLRDFSDGHADATVEIETHDLETGEEVTSREVRLQKIELDTEDAKNPRVNVHVASDNKEIKHIFFCPSQLTLMIPDTNAHEALRIDSINTSTIVRVRTRAGRIGTEAA